MYAWEIPQKVVFKKKIYHKKLYFLKYFKTGLLYELHSVWYKNISKNTTGNTIKHSNKMLMGNITPWKVVFLAINIFAVYNANYNPRHGMANIAHI